MYSRQFVVADSGSDTSFVPSTWVRTAVRGLTLRHSEDLPVVKLRCADGQGLVLGWPIYKGRMWSDGEVLDYGEPDAAPLFPMISGRFLILLASPDKVTCYLDPLGSLPAVYARGRRILASTVSLIPIANDCAEDGELRAAFGIPEKDNWYPFGLTGRKNIRRLLPNHALDLSDFTERRYWPRSVHRILRGEADSRRAVSQIAAVIRENAAAVADQSGAMCNLTAGRDTRMILAALRPHLDKVTFSTIGFPDDQGRHDVALARRIARRHRLRHRELPYFEPLRADLDEWLVNTGFCVAGRTLHLATTSRHIAQIARFNLTGVGGEVGRSLRWKPGDPHGIVLSVDELMRRMKLNVPVLPQVREAGDAWISSLPSATAPWLLDIAMIELELGCFSWLSFYGHCHGGISISPFNDRRAIEPMLSLPHEYRASQRLTPDLLDEMWPDLNLFPFNPHQESRSKLWKQRINIAGRRARTWARKLTNRSSHCR